MTITTLAEMRAAMDASDCQTLPFFKTGTLASQVAGSWSSLWRMAGIPAQPSIPSTAASCNHQTLGGLNFVNPLGSEKLHIVGSMLNEATGGSSNYNIVDRLAHMGGLSGTVTTSQSVGVDLNGLAGTDNISARKGKSDYSEVRWWVECYTALGGTSVLMQVNYVDQTGTGQTTSVQIPASLAAGRLLPIYSLTVGANIRSISSVTLAATTGTAGSFGITATRAITELKTEQGTIPDYEDWGFHALAEVKPSSCLAMIRRANATSIQAPWGTLRLAQG